MSFEKIVLDQVAKTLKADGRANFTCGCLFVECNEKEARKVFHTLSKEFGVGKVLINGPIQGEYAYDII